MKTENALIMFCEHCELIMNTFNFDFDSEYAWYEFECPKCFRKRRVSITLNFDQNEKNYCCDVFNL